MKKKTLEFLEAHKSETPSTWREEAEWRRDNWSWLRHSQKIAVLTSSLVRYFYLPHDGTYGFKGVSEDLTGDSG